MHHHYRRAFVYIFLPTASEAASRSTRETEVAISGIHFSTNENAKRYAPTKDVNESEGGR